MMPADGSCLQLVGVNLVLVDVAGLYVLNDFLQGAELLFAGRGAQDEQHDCCNGYGDDGDEESAHRVGVLKVLRFARTPLFYITTIVRSAGAWCASASSTNLVRR